MVVGSVPCKRQPGWLSIVLGGSVARRPSAPVRAFAKLLRGKSLLSNTVHSSCHRPWCKPVPSNAKMLPAQLRGETGLAKKMMLDTTTLTRFSTLATEKDTGLMPCPSMPSCTKPGRAGGQQPPIGDQPRSRPRSRPLPASSCQMESDHSRNPKESSLGTPRGGNMRTPLGCRP